MLLFNYNKVIPKTYGYNLGYVFLSFDRIKIFIIIVIIIIIIINIVIINVIIISQLCKHSYRVVLAPSFTFKRL